MSESKKETRTLRVLLLVCAGALLVILLSITISVYETQAMRAETEICGIPERNFSVYPSILQRIMIDDCQTQIEDEPH